MRIMYTNNPKGLKLAVPTKNGTLFLNEQDIIYCQAKGSYTQIYTRENSTLLITKGLHKVQASLSEEFIRVHHSYIVNLNHVVGYAISKPNSITLTEGTVLNVSRNRKKAFLDCYKAV